jgi:1,4-alpha-glucan branching enzyme
MMFTFSKKVDIISCMGNLEHILQKRWRKRNLFFSLGTHAKKVSVIGNFNNWNHKDHILFPRWDESGIWEGFIEGLTWGTLYKYAIETPRGEILEKSDPYALSWEQNIQAASLVSTTWYEWNDRNGWKTAGRKTVLMLPYLFMNCILALG